MPHARKGQFPMAVPGVIKIPVTSRAAKITSVWEYHVYMSLYVYVCVRVFVYIYEIVGEGM